MTFVRTVLGDIEPTALGVTYAHEHVVIDPGRATALYPDFLLDDVELMATEVGEAAALGLHAVIDAMPADTGRNATKLAELSRRTGVHIVAPTGLHHERFYGPAHWSTRLDESALADLFSADVLEGIDANDYSGPLVRRTAQRAGVIKIGGSDGGPSARDAPIFIAAADTHRRTGVPILTHCEAGTGALEQVRLLTDHGVPADHIVLSHVDKVTDTGYHSALLETGAFGEYDQGFRWGDGPNRTLDLLEAMTAAGLGDRIVLGMDAARRGYYHVYGGSPGLGYLLDGFSRAMTERGLGADVWRAVFIENPARAFAFAPPADGTHDATAPTDATTEPIAVTGETRMTQPIRPADRSGGLLTGVVGSHARPSWFVSGLDAAERGEFGPVDLEEMYVDAVDVAIRDQEQAGIDVVSDGEMRRAGFFTAEFYKHLTGVRTLPPPRRLGAGGHDQQHMLEVLEPITAPHGLGVVAEYRAAVSRATRPLKMTMPGPYTLSGRLVTGPGNVYPDRLSAAEAFVPLIRAELTALADAGATVLQLDEPSPAIHPDAGADFAGLFNAAIEPVVGRVRLGAHLCFGNFMGRPLARRSYRPILAAMLSFRVDELVLEFANREMAETDLLAEITGAGRDVAVGVVDVKNYHLETADDVAERIDRVLAAGVPADHLALVPDCGFSQTARWATQAKLRALVAGRDLVAGRAGRT